MEFSRWLASESERNHACLNSPGTPAGVPGFAGDGLFRWCTPDGDAVPGVHHRLISLHASGVRSLMRYI
jgi:hypothetical protein